MTGGLWPWVSLQSPALFEQTMYRVRDDCRYIRTLVTTDRLVTHTQPAALFAAFVAADLVWTALNTVTVISQGLYALFVANEYLVTFEMKVHR